MLINKNWFLEKKKQLYSEDYKINGVKEELPTYIESRISKLLMYYLSYEYGKSKGLSMYKNIDYVISFDKNIIQTQEEYFKNIAYLKYKVKDIDDEVIIEII